MNKKRLGAFVLAGLLALAVAAPAQAATRAEIEAQIAMLKAQLAVLIGGTSMNFTTNMTVGSTGSEVTRLQSFLIEKGYGIPAGATGYFGAQTQSALARYQAANAIAPAAGYFGPLTRTKVNAMLVVVNPTPTPTPTPDNDDDDDDNGNDADAQDARDAIGDLEDAIEQADDDISNSDDDARDILEEAEEKVDEAEDAFDDRDYDEAVDLAEEGMDLVDEARDEAGLDSDNDDADENDAEDAIDDLDAAIEDAQDDIDEAEDDGEDVDDANDILDEAREKLADAEDAYDDEDYEDAADLADEGMDLVDEALDEANVDNDNDDSDGDAETIDTSAVTTTVSGSDNDYATFTIELELRAFGGDMYIPRDADDAFTYRIEDAGNGNTVSGGTRSETISSSAETEGDYFFIADDETETFTFRVTFNPEAADEGNDFRMQLLTIEYADEEEAPTATWSTNGDSEFETEPTYIAD